MDSKNTLKVSRPVSDDFKSIFCEFESAKYV
ncbi:hypothetical protein LKACC12383_01769 [Companilactobacillus kimchii]|uniref:Uncharacterized protein n=1 Tax=Companilactobacillus kimchii TaxID=2801452 RepID=A0A210P7U6_9LACO|nr:hypothetical protein LKACC12383_01769 [Companilactobacillus kimchii]